MIVVIKNKGETKDSLFRKFHRQFKEENITFDVAKKMFYKKRSLLKKEKERERLKRKAQEKRKKQRHVTIY
jgi:ribosomal protein S21